MKHSVIVLCLLLCVRTDGFSQKYEIWGVWNVGSPSDSVKFTNNDGSYLWIRDTNSLIFQRDYHGNGPRINYEGGHYKIKEIIYEKSNIISLYVENLQPVLTKEGKITMGMLSGKINIYFIDEDHMWMELDYSDKTYPTALDFSQGDFKGRDVVFWRKRIE
jgi:hypothetical protein